MSTINRGNEVKFQPCFPAQSCLLAAASLHDAVVQSMLQIDANGRTSRAQNAS